jgi:hypothetical protein
MSRHPGLCAAVVLALAAALELLPSLTGARMLSPESLLFGYEPFAAYRPPDVGPTNPLLSDVPTAFQPWAHTIKQAISAGRFPSWDPTALLGVPLGANPQAQLFNPLALPLRILPLDWAYGLVAALKLWFAGFGAYLLARELRCGFWPALAAGFVLLSSSYMVVWLQWPHTASFCFLPWVLWLVERSARGSRGAGVALAAPVAMLVLGGHPGTYAQALFLTALYAVLRLVLLRDVTARERGARAATVAGGLALGVALAAPELLPTLFNRGGSTGLTERLGADPTLPLAAGRTAIFPDWWGRPGHVGGGATVGNYNERTVFSGVAALVLAAVAVSRRDRWRASAPIVAIAALGGLVAFGAEPFHAVVHAIPPLDSLNAQRMVFAVNIGVAVLAGLGLQALVDGHGRRAALVAACAVLAACLVALAGVGPDLTDVKETVLHFVKGTDYVSAHVLELTAIAWAVAFAVGILLLATLRPRIAVTWFAVAAVVLVAIDGARFMHGYNPQVPDSARPPEPASIRFVRARGAGERVTAIGEVLPPDSGALYGLRDLRGHDPPDPPKRLVRLLHTGWPLVGYQSRLVLPPTLDARGLRVLDTLGVRWVFTSRRAPTPRLPGLEQAYKGPDAKVLRSSTTSGRAYVPRRVIGVAGEGALLRELQAPGFRPGRDVLVDGARTTAGRGTVRVTRDEPARVDLKVDMAKGGLVVLNDSLRDGWSVRVDGGQGAVPLQVNSVVRGVTVPAGRHTVTWTYRVPGLRLSFLIVGLALLAAGAWLVVLRRISRSARVPQAA